MGAAQLLLVSSHRVRLIKRFRENEIELAYADLTRLRLVKTEIEEHM